VDKREKKKRKIQKYLRMSIDQKEGFPLGQTFKIDNFL
jgi:hypothetical protein